MKEFYPQSLDERHETWFHLHEAECRGGMVADDEIARVGSQPPARNMTITFLSLHSGAHGGFVLREQMIDASL
jgi:hypothetical protein